MDFWTTFFASFFGSGVVSVVLTVGKDIYLKKIDVSLKKKEISRQEDNKHCEDARGKITEIRDISHGFWLKDSTSLGEDNLITRDKILVLFSDLQILINRLKNHTIDADDHYVHFKRAVTTNFDSALRKANRDTALRIIQTAQELIEQIDRELSKTYRV